MKNKMTLDGEFAKALPILKRIIAAGFEAYFVGGSVRDRLLHLNVNDVDIATSALPHEIKKIFKRTVDVGIEHGTVMVLIGDASYEITTFRTESTYKDFRRPDSVTFVRSLLEDLKRRDFTMNAIALDIDGHIIDPFDGMLDLEKTIIRAVGDPHERFKEDALRMMRAVRFAAQLEFEIEPETMLSIRENAHLLEKIAVERIQVEFEKLLTAGWHTLGLASMIRTRLYLYCPGLADKKAALLAMIDDELPFENARQAWAYLLFHIEQTNSKDTFHPKKFLKKWKLSNQLISDALTLYKALKYRLENGALDKWMIFNIGRDFSMEVEYLVEHMKQTPAYIEVLGKYDDLPIKESSQLAISGHDIMQLTTVRPGKWMSEAINAALKAVVLNHLPNDKEVVLSWLTEQQYIPEP